MRKPRLEQLLLVSNIVIIIQAAVLVANLTQMIDNSYRMDSFFRVMGKYQQGINTLTNKGLSLEKQFLNLENKFLEFKDEQKDGVPFSGEIN